jgi:hypothetical protein
MVVRTVSSMDYDNGNMGRYRMVGGKWLAGGTREIALAQATRLVEMARSLHYLDT